MREERIQSKSERLVFEGKWQGAQMYKMLDYLWLFSSSKKTKHNKKTRRQAYYYITLHWLSPIGRSGKVVV